MKHRTAFFPVLFFIIICLAFNYMISGHYNHKVPEPDESLYNAMALSLMEGNSTFNYDGQKVDIGMEVTPFYPALVAGVYMIKNTRWSPIILNIMLNCITVVLLFFIIKYITGRLIMSFLSSLAFTLYFPLWAYNFFIMMEIPTVFLLTLAIYFLTEHFRRKRTMYLFLATAVFAILVLINNRFFVLMGVYLLILLYLAVFMKSITYRKLAFSFLIITLIIGPWFVRQYIVYDQFVFFTPKWNNLVSETVGIFKPVNFTSIEDMSDSYKLQDYDYYLKMLERNKNNFSGNKNQFTKEKYLEAINGRDRIENIYLARIVRYFTLFDNEFRFLYPDSFRMVVPSSLPYKLIQIFILLPLFVFSFLGFIIAIIRRKLIIICLSLLWFSHILLHVLIHYIDRYRLTILPVLLIISAYGFTEGITWVKNIKIDQNIYFKHLITH